MEEGQYTGVAEGGRPVVAKMQQLEGGEVGRMRGVTAEIGASRATCPVDRGGGRDRFVRRGAGNTQLSVREVCKYTHPAR